MNQSLAFSELYFPLLHLCSFRQKGREREIPSRLHSVRMEPHVGLDLTNPEIMP